MVLWKVKQCTFLNNLRKRVFIVTEIISRKQKRKHPQQVFKTQLQEKRVGPVELLTFCQYFLSGKTKNHEGSSRNLEEKE